jgi:hypothetical protein
VLVLHDKVTGGFRLKHGEDKNQAREDDVKARWHQPPDGRGVTQIDLAAVVGEICQDNAEVNEAGEETSAKTADACGGNLSDVDGPYNGRLAYAETCDEPAGVDGAEIAVGRHEDGDADNPQDAQLAGRPDSANFVADKESAVSS